MPNSPSVLLAINNLTSGYGKKQILNGISLTVKSGDIVALIGHNGAGKSTLLKTIFGLIPIWDGEVILDGMALSPPTPRRLLKSGVAYVPQGNRIFTDLTVGENLKMGGETLANKSLVRDGMERALDFFPALKPMLSQRAGILSGGEKQMLALSNALVLSPRLLLLDEPSLGLSPPSVARALRRIEEISTGLDTGVLVVEQKVREVLKIARYVYVIRNGLVSFSGKTHELDEQKLREAYF